MPFLNPSIQKLGSELLQLTLLTWKLVLESLGLIWAGTGRRLNTVVMLVKRNKRWVWSTILSWVVLVVPICVPSKEWYLRDVPYLTSILIFVELQVCEVIFERMSHNNLVVENLLENRCNLGIGGRVLEVNCLDASDPLTVVLDFSPRLDQTVKHDIAVEVDNRNAC